MGHFSISLRLNVPNWVICEEGGPNFQAKPGKVWDKWRKVCKILFISKIGKHGGTAREHFEMRFFACNFYKHLKLSQFILEYSKLTIKPSPTILSQNFFKIFTFRWPFWGFSTENLLVYGHFWVDCTLWTVAAYICTVKRSKDTRRKLTSSFTT